MHTIKNILTVLLLLSLVGIAELRAQSGMNYAELQEKLQPYFAEEFLRDIKAHLPPGEGYRIWGWDVGDFSGDGYFDVAMALYTIGSKSKVVDVYLFADVEGYMQQVGKFAYPFLELPIEVGVVIDDTTCYIMQKQRQYHWSRTGYRFDKGALILVDSFSTEPKPANLTYEQYRNYQTLLGYEKYRHTRSGEEQFFSEFYCIPSYRRGRYIYKGYFTDVASSSVRFVPSGAYYWDGEEDAALTVRSAYDEDYLYFSVHIRDDKVVSADIEGGTSDRIEIWLDVAGSTNRTPPSAENDYRSLADSGIFAFNIFPGNFADRKAYHKISSTDDLDDIQRQAITQVRVVAGESQSGYVAKIRIPFQLLGFDGVPLGDDNVTELGCSVIAFDVDNEFRPEEETAIATSKFEDMNPASYGVLLLVPDGLTYGQANNIYIEPVAERLKELGF